MQQNLGNIINKTDLKKFEFKKKIFVREMVKNNIATF